MSAPPPIKIAAVIPVILAVLPLFWPNRVTLVDDDEGDHR